MSSVPRPAPSQHAFGCEHPDMWIERIGSRRYRTDFQFPPTAGGAVVTELELSPGCRLRTIVAVALAFIAVVAVGAPVASATPAYSVVPIEPSGLNGASFSCVVAHQFCVGVGTGGEAILFTGGGWKPLGRIDPQNPRLEAVSCPATTFCVAVGAKGAVDTFDGGRWGRTAMIDQPAIKRGGTVLWVSCASRSFCLANDYDGNLIAFNGKAWGHATKLFGGLYGVQCRSTSFCVAARRRGVAFYDGRRWTAASRFSVSVAQVSCATKRVCVAIDFNGDAFRFNGRSWSQPAIVAQPGPGGLDGVDCVSISFCMVFGSHGDSATLKRGVWTHQQILSADPGPDLPDYVSGACGSPTLCVAEARVADGSGRRGLFSFDGRTWT